MRRFCCGLMLAALCASAAAAWVQVGVADDGMVVYADPASIRTTGDVVKMWALLDYKNPEKDDSGKLFQSAKLLHDYDCKQERARTQYYSLHTGKMGTGLVVLREDRANSEWLSAHRAIIGETLWKLACSKK